MLHMHCIQKKSHGIFLHGSLDHQTALTAAAQMAFLHESVIVAGEEIAFYLPHRVQRDADDDQQACATEELSDQRLDAHAAAEKHR